MIIRVSKKDDPYVRLDKHFINDKRLSLKAVGIMTYLLSKQDGWHVRVGDIINQHKDGKSGVRSGIKELKDYGYMQPNITRDPKTGRLLKYDYDVFERPLTDFQEVVSPLTDFQEVDNQEVDNRTLNNKGLLLKDDSNNKGKKVNNNNKGKPSKIKDTIIIHKRRFKRLKPKIIKMGWVGSFNEIIKLHNKDPERVEGWVYRVGQIEIENQAGLLRKSLRSGAPVPTREETNRQRKNYLDGPFSEYIEKEKE